MQNPQASKCLRGRESKEHRNGMLYFGLQLHFSFYQHGVHGVLCIVSRFHFQKLLGSGSYGSKLNFQDGRVHFVETC